MNQETPIETKVQIIEPKPDIAGDAEGFLTDLRKAEDSESEASEVKEESSEDVEAEEVSEGEDIESDSGDEDSEDEDSEDSPELSKNQKKKLQSVKRLAKKLDEQEAVFTQESAEANSLMLNAVEEIDQLRGEVARLTTLAESNHIDYSIDPAVLENQALQKQLREYQIQDEVVQQQNHTSHMNEFHSEVQLAAESAGITVPELASRLHAMKYTGPDKTRELTFENMQKEAQAYANFKGVAVSQQQLTINKQVPKTIKAGMGKSKIASYQRQPGEQDVSDAATRFLTDLRANN